MTLKKKAVLAAGAALALYLTASTLAWALGGGFPDREDIREFMIYKLDKETAALGLSDGQQKKYANMKERLLLQMEENRKSRDELRARIKAELEKPEPDVKLAASMLRQKLPELQSSLNGHIDLFLEFYDILDKNQQTAFLDHIKEKLNHHCR